MYFLGIDVGTGGTRALIINESGQVIASATKEHEAFGSPEIGWAEQDPQDWWRACGRSVQKALADAERNMAVLGRRGIKFTDFVQTYYNSKQLPTFRIHVEGQDEVYYDEAEYEKRLDELKADSKEGEEEELKLLKDSSK